MPNVIFRVFIKDHPETLQLFKSFRDLFDSEEEMKQDIFRGGPFSLSTKALPPIGPFRINEVTYGGNGIVEFSSIASWKGLIDLQCVGIFFSFTEDNPIEFNNPTMFSCSKFIK